MGLDPQQKGLADAHEGPALIAYPNGDIHYANEPLRALLSADALTVEPRSLFHLGTLDIARNAQEFKAFVNNHGEALTISFEEPRYAKITQLNFQIEKSQEFNDDSVLLLAHLKDVMGPPLEAEIPDQVSNTIESRVLRQTAKLAAQSEQRAQAEERAKLEAERKVKLIGNTVHHLNNPLNQIQGAFDLVHLEIATLRQTINELLQPEEADPETEAVRKNLDVKFLLALDNLSAIDSAASRIADTTDILRLVSGIDGWSFRETTVAEIAAAAERRLSSAQKSKLRSLTDTYGTTQVVGHPVIYAQAIEEIERGLDQLGLESQEIKAQSNPDFQILSWDPITPYSSGKGSHRQVIATTTIRYLTQLQQLKREVEHLLQAYDVTVVLTDTGIDLRIPMTAKNHKL